MPTVDELLGPETPARKPSVNEMLAEPMSFTEGVGTGLLDKFYGAAQLGGHIAAVPEQAMAPNFGMVPEETRKTVDETVQQREREIQAAWWRRCRPANRQSARRCRYDRAPDGRTGCRGCCYVGR